MRRACLIAAILCGILAAVAFDAVLSRATGEPTAVDTVLSLGLDVSGSIDQHRFEIQRQAVTSALTSPRFLAAVQDGEHQSIALSVYEWSGKGQQTIILPWTLIRTKGDAEKAAAALGATPRSWSDMTAVGEAIGFGVHLIAASPYQGRKVLDISGDGIDNCDGDMPAARRLAELAGVTVNGLPIRGNSSDDVEGWYRANVPTAHGFVMPAQGFEDLEDALLAKIEREVS